MFFSMLANTITKKDVFNVNNLKRIASSYGKGIILTAENMVDFTPAFDTNPPVQFIRDHHHFLIKRQTSYVSIIY